MIDPSSLQSRAPTRRIILLRGAAYAAGAAAVLGAVSRADAAKMAQTAAAYQATPKGLQQCDNCLLFQAPKACQIVDGEIGPSGWCKFWAKKPG
jgi:high potential iron-sulfur protein